MKITKRKDRRAREWGRELRRVQFKIKSAEPLKEATAPLTSTNSLSLKVYIFLRLIMSHV